MSSDDLSDNDVFDDAASQEDALESSEATDGAHREDPVSEEDEAADEQRSVIMHLLKQLSIGMDLTRVTLPTAYLEKRSLLEMFADFMTIPSYFVAIDEATTPRDRMMAVVRFYMTSFHSFRKGHLAKKPYNPILGETFTCQWDLSEEGKGITTYFAEQVSHHPPVSAFYFENREHRMYINAHVWTQSRFLGTSVASMLVGQASLRLLNHGGEEYILTFPNAYARSIFTVPKMELGGKTTIACEATGFAAEIEFKTKPMIGGQWHEVVCQVRDNPDPRKPFCRIAGKWNGELEITDLQTKETSEFFKASNAHGKMRKAVRPLDAQGDYESRKLWREVTEALRAKDIPTATKAKEFLENRQRKEAAERKEAGTEWVPRHFALVGDLWVYKNILTA